MDDSKSSPSTYKETWWYRNRWWVSAPLVPLVVVQFLRGDWGRAAALVVVVVVPLILMHSNWYLERAEKNFQLRRRSTEARKTRPERPPNVYDE